MIMKNNPILALLGLASLLVLAGCEPPRPEKVERTSNGMTIMRLATIEGCGLYRVNQGNGDRDVYTTICPAAERTSTQWAVSCGKGCLRDEIIPMSRKVD